MVYHGLCLGFSTDTEKFGISFIFIGMFFVAGFPLEHIYDGSEHSSSRSDSKVRNGRQLPVRGKSLPCLWSAHNSANRAPAPPSPMESPSEQPECEAAEANLLITFCVWGHGAPPPRQNIEPSLACEYNPTGIVSGPWSREAIRYAETDDLRILAVA